MNVAMVYRSEYNRTSMATRGPKPKPLKERRRNRVMLNLDDAEYQRLVDAAADEPPSTYARRVLLRHLDRRER